MSKATTAVAGALLLLGGAFLEQNSGSAAKAAEPCDRACLNGVMDQYLAAMLKHDPSQVPLAPKARYTENTNEMAFGDGLWQTITSLNNFKIYIADPKTGQVVYYGAGIEGGQVQPIDPMLYGVRLKVANHKVTEAEAFAVRRATANGSPGATASWDNIVADPVWSQPLAPSERVPRAQMIKAANAYFDGIVQGNGDIVPFDDECIRVENGVQTAPSPARGDRPPMTAKQQFNSKAFMYIHEIAQRRYPVVDEERGIVFGTVMFEHPGNIKSGPVVPNSGVTAASAASGPIPEPANGRYGTSSFPNSTEIVEAFKVRNGKLYRINAMVSMLPYRQKPGW